MANYSVVRQPSWTKTTEDDTLEDVRVTITQLGRYTHAIAKMLKLTGEGISRRSHEDRHVDKLKGDGIAIGRALKALRIKFHGDVVHGNHKLMA